VRGGGAKTENPEDGRVEVDCLEDVERKKVSQRIKEPYLKERYGEDTSLRLKESNHGGGKTARGRENIEGDADQPRENERKKCQRLMAK